MSLARPLLPIACSLLALGVLAPAPRAAVVINEVDYQQPVSDNAEFIELKNTGSSAVSLSGYTVELVEVVSGAASVYKTLTLPSATVPANGYYVICFGLGTVSNCSVFFGPTVSAIHNTLPGAIGLRNAGVLVDAVSWGGSVPAPYTEGTGCPQADDGVNYGIGLSRFPDGVDTNDNSVDWSRRCISPGLPNSAGSSGCIPVNARTSCWGALKACYR